MAMARMAILAIFGHYGHYGYGNFQYNHGSDLYPLKVDSKSYFYTLKMKHGQKVIRHVFYHPKLKNSNMFFGQSY